MHRSYQSIEIRGFKWPRRATSVTVAQLLGEDTFGCWLGVPRGTPWRLADNSRSGVFDAPLVKLVPIGTCWTACFHPLDPVIDVDIVLPVQWQQNLLEEVDLELDILRLANGHVYVRDQDKFDELRTTWSLQDNIARQAKETCKWVQALVEKNTEPFGQVYRTWLSQFLAGTDTATGPAICNGEQ